MKKMSSISNHASRDWTDNLKVLSSRLTQAHSEKCTFSKTL